MKLVFFIVAIGAGILFTQSMLGLDKLPGALNKQSDQNIFARYDSTSDALFLSDSETGPEKPAHKHNKDAAKGDKIKWHWRGNHSNINFVTVIPKGTNPFDTIYITGNVLNAKIKTVIDTGKYGYSIKVVLNGQTRTFDPTIQIH
jgi:hypothetical protein